MAVGRISGPLLSQNLFRDNIPLAFYNTASSQEPILLLDVTATIVGINTSTFLINPDNFYEKNLRLDVNGTGRFKYLIVESTSTIGGQLFVTSESNPTGFFGYPKSDVSTVTVDASTGSSAIYISTLTNVQVGYTISGPNITTGTTVLTTSTTGLITLSLPTSGFISSSTSVNLKYVPENIGAAVISGGVNIARDVWIGGSLYINSSTTFQSSATFNSDLHITAKIESVSTTTGALVIDGGVGIGRSINIGGNAVVTGTTVLYSPTFIISTASSTSTTSGALQVTGGVGVQGSVYSSNGNPLENNLLYSAKVTISNNGVAPLNPHIGDFWIDSSINAEMQYIQDGNNRFWLQVTTI